MRSKFERDSLDTYAARRAAHEADAAHLRPPSIHTFPEPSDNGAALRRRTRLRIRTMRGPEPLFVVAVWACVALAIVAVSISAVTLAAVLTGW
jgi:hypothetical protein